MSKKNKSKKRQFKKGDTVYFVTDDNEVYKTTVMEIDGSDILTSYMAWENKRLFLPEDDPRIKECIGEWIDSTEDWTEEMWKEQEEMLKKAHAW